MSQVRSLQHPPYLSNFENFLIEQKLIIRYNKDNADLKKQIAGVLKVQLKSWDRPGKKLRAFFVGLIHLTDWGFDFQLVPPNIPFKALKRGDRYGDY